MLKCRPFVRASARAVRLVAACAGIVACTRPPGISDIGAVTNPLDALSAIVTFRAPCADSARIVYSTPADTASATPYAPVTNGAGRVVMLGLLPLSYYALTVQARCGHQQVVATWTYETPGLPPRVQKASLVPTGKFTRGLTLVSPLAIIPTTDSAIAVAFDALGRLRWYRVFPVTGSVDLQQQPNGHFTILLPLSSWQFSDRLVRGGPGTTALRHAVPGGYDGTPTEYVEFLPSGEIVNRYTAGPGEFTDAHEFVMTGTAANPVLHLFGYTRRPFDFASLGGPSNATGVGHQLIRESPPGVVEFRWDAWDHFGAADWIEPTGAAPPDDFDHPNSLTFDLDGNYIMSFRNMGAVVKVDMHSGAIMWQLGGRLNQFQIRNDPLRFFSGQHFVRVLPNGHLLLFDNGLRHKPAISRAVEYALDETHKVATMVWDYEPHPALLSTAFGSAQRLSNGNTLVGFGYPGQIHEVDAHGKPIAVATFSYGDQGTFYRALRIASLYEFERP